MAPAGGGRDGLLTGSRKGCPHFAESGGTLRESFGFLFSMPTARLLLVSAALAGTTLWAPGAQALTMATQTSSSRVFSLTGTSTSANTLSFSRFNPNLVGDDKYNVTLLGYDYILTNVAAGGTVQLGNSGPTAINGPFLSQATLDFDRLDASSNVAFNPVQATSVGSVAPGSFTTLPLSGSATNVVSPDPFIPLANTVPYITPPSSPLPSLTGYSASWAYISPPGPLSNYEGATLNGRIAVRWHYSYDLQIVPAPLPLAGAGIALAWSRGLRRRVRQSA